MTVTEALSEKARRFRERRDAVREDLNVLANVIEEQLNLENALADDEPEGSVITRIQLSKTYAGQLVKSLRHAEALL